jgi:hypothetical protein
MKRRAALISTVAIFMLLSASTILGAAQCPVSNREYDKLVQSNFKNQCLIVAKNCATESNTVQQRVNELRVEIAKGLDVYTPNELRALKEQLKWINSSSSNQFI